MVKMRPGEKQLWRVLNASAITYLDLQMLVNDKPQMMGVVSLDGVPHRTKTGWREIALSGRATCCCRRRGEWESS